MGGFIKQLAQSSPSGTPGAADRCRAVPEQGREAHETGFIYTACRHQFQSIVEVEQHDNKPCQALGIIVAVWQTEETACREVLMHPDLRLWLGTLV